MRVRAWDRLARVNLSPGQLAVGVGGAIALGVVAFTLALYIAITSSDTAREQANAAVASSEANRVGRELADCGLYELLVARPTDPRTGNPRPMPAADNDRGWDVAEGVRNVWVKAKCGRLLDLPEPPPTDVLRARAAAAGQAPTPEQTGLTPPEPSPTP